MLCGSIGDDAAVTTVRLMQTTAKMQMEIAAALRREKFEFGAIV